MPTLFYPALLEPASDRGYSVFFPDVPGCISAGDSRDNALQNAIEALQLHFDGLREDGIKVPQPGSSITWPRWAGRQPKGILRALVPAEVSESSVRLNITMDRGLLARVDRAAEAEGMTRSGFLAQAARERLAATKSARRPAAKRSRAA